MVKFQFWVDPHSEIFDKRCMCQSLVRNGVGRMVCVAADFKNIAFGVRYFNLPCGRP